MYRTKHVITMKTLINVKCPPPCHFLVNIWPVSFSDNGGWQTSAATTWPHLYCYTIPHNTQYNSNTHSIWNSVWVRYLTLSFFLLFLYLLNDCFFLLFQFAICAFPISFYSDLYQQNSKRVEFLMKSSKGSSIFYLLYRFLSHSFHEPHFFLHLLKLFPSVWAFSF